MADKPESMNNISAEHALLIQKISDILKAQNGEATQGHVDHVPGSEYEPLNYFRYAGYSAILSRSFRYLAFTSDFGEAFRPIVSARIVTGTYIIAIGYCFADVGIEAYKLHNRGYVHEKTKEPLSMAQLVVERSTFQAVASVIGPFLIIHTSVDMTKRLCTRMGRFQKWGPTLVGLSIIPFLPVCLDHPVEQGLEWAFKRYGPWAEKEHKD